MAFSRYSLKRRLDRSLWYPLRQIVQVVHPLPLLASGVVAYLLAASGQMREIYIATLEANSAAGGPAMQTAAALLGLALLTATMYFANFALSGSRIDIVYAQHESPSLDRWLSRLRDITGVVVATGPWAGLLAGMWLAANATFDSANRLACALDATDACQANDAAVRDLAAASHALSTALPFVAGTGFLLIAFLNLVRNWRSVQLAFTGLLLAVVVSLVASPYLFGEPDASPVDLVAVFRSIGSLGMTAALATSLFACIAALSLLSGNVGFPVIGLTLLLFVMALLFKLPLDVVALCIAALFGVLVITGLLSAHYALAALASVLMLASFAMGRQAGLSARGAEPAGALPALETAAPPQTVAQGFDAWLAQRDGLVRAHQAATQKRFPVFVVAAQGGGIYAAVAASAFLTRMQEVCPSFAQHVFAISGVSGGAIGAATFQGLLGDVPVGPADCSGIAASGRLGWAGERIMRDDHLAVLLGYTLADLAGTHVDRARALELSFARSALDHAGSNALTRPFRQHWKPAAAAPALVLNATWTETGYNVAFSPFSLDGLRDGTIYSFSDGMLGLMDHRDGTVIEAAVTSARFPGVVPAFTLARHSANGERRRWNFVDGGYSDGSGAAAALEIFKALEARIEGADKDSLLRQVDVRILLLTSASGQLDFANIEGSFGRDSVAPIATLLSVRDRLTEKAIKRTVTEAGTRTDGGRAWRVAIVELDQESFKLSLGWTVSGATYGLVRKMLGEPDSCRRETGSTAREATRREAFLVSRRRIAANSCIQRDIVDLIRN